MNICDPPLQNCRCSNEPIYGEFALPHFWNTIQRLGVEFHAHAKRAEGYKAFLYCYVPAFELLTDNALELDDGSFDFAVACLNYMYKFNFVACMMRRPDWYKIRKDLRIATSCC